MAGNDRIRWPVASMVLVAYMAAADVAPGGGLLASSRTCKGHQREWEVCHRDSCGDACKPVDCSFSEWSDWKGRVDCTGLCERYRDVQAPNNDCGQPCRGAKVETKRCQNDACAYPKVVNCEFESWSDWSVCVNQNEQKKRYRNIKVEAKNFGTTCQGITQETAPCGKAHQIDCKWSEWGEWTTCSKSCGGGWHVSMRRWVHHAQGGQPCTGSLRRVAECKTTPCNVPQDCKVGPWSDWSASGSVQQFRERGVKVAATAGGKPCGLPLKQTMGISVNNAPVDCILGDWSSWSHCPVTCGGGQATRRRDLLVPPDNGGEPCDGNVLKETIACNVVKCLENHEANCGISKWSEWSPCSSTCGIGAVQRNRKVLWQARDETGKGCNGPLREVAACHGGPCPNQDCQWDDWASWSDCTCTCGGGTKRRFRAVRVPPRGSGKLCVPEDKSEIAACNLQSCDICVDGTWMSWGEWSKCSATCGKGFRARHRDLSREPNHCGMAAEGLEDAYEACEAEVPCTKAVDCQLSTWTEWSDCSCSCFGVKERHRSIVQWSSGAGKPCDKESLKEVSPCHPDPGEKLPENCETPIPKPCIFSHWSDWTHCSATCGKSSKSRSRQVQSPAELSGAACEGGLDEVTPCNLDDCKEDPCIDCQWGDWEDWGACASCGGQRYRHRIVVQLPNHCGEPCVASHAKETEHCHSPCEDKFYCTWGQWSALSGCNAQCGPATRTRERSLTLTNVSAGEGTYLFVGTEGSGCGGLQTEVHRCRFPSCEKPMVAQDCQLEEWSEWSHPTCTKLCERHRGIARTNNALGKPCLGSLVDTKHCPYDCTKPKDCVLSAWTEWSGCADTATQRKRTRHIIQDIENGGKPCEAALVETGSCSGPPPSKQDCRLKEWDDWSECSVTCGGGVHKRQREMIRASSGGAPCSGDMEQLESCNSSPCTDTTRQSCKLSEWSDWGKCSDDLSGGERERVRIIVQPAQNGGLPCHGFLSELQQCSASQDCVVSAWTTWDPCDKTCDSGEQQRHRQVQSKPQQSGKPCEKQLVEIRGCAKEPCESIHCKMGDWKQWSSCSAECGPGQQARSRQVLHMAKKGGAGCDGALEETKRCEAKPCWYADCKWGDWSQWGKCSSSCGGGTRERERNITTLPSKDGKPCDAVDKQELEPCGLEKCQSTECVDGEWDDWGDWEPCSMTCVGGLTWRKRKVRREANACGDPPVGQSLEYAECNEGIHCGLEVNGELSSWEDWEICSKKCGGVQRRSRTILVHSQNGGAPAEGALQELRSCGGDKGACKEEIDIDCELTPWSTWDDCTASCGGGQRQRSRKVLQPPEGEGKRCETNLAETEACGNKQCGKTCEPQDCAWNDWSEWGLCDKCGGQRNRSRHVLQHAACGGKACQAGNSEETENCTRSCHEKSFCTWGLWGTWTNCSASCGVGRRSRTRYLDVKPWSKAIPAQFLQADSDNLAEEDLQEHLRSLRDRSKGMEAERSQELLLAFASGLLSLAAVLSIARRLPKGREREAPLE